MNWWSETAVLWLPIEGQPYPDDFPKRANPGSSVFYYALDASDAISRRRAEEVEREPWAYLVHTGQILSPTEIDRLMDEWCEQLRASEATTVVPSSP